jgi:cyclopropane fatty-acyl-phospholipid synthase-like methyltransferase
MAERIVTSFEPDELYATAPPWELGRPQPVFLDLAQRGAISCRVLDVGCGTGEHTLMCSQLGLAATGIDLAEPALKEAENKARELGLTARFLRHDAVRVAELGESFDTVLDCGLFHMPHFTPDDRAAYVTGLATVLSSVGRYFMLCFSDSEPDDQRGPHRFTRDEIATWFADGWQLNLIEPATIEVTTDRGCRHAWLVAASRT